MMMPCPSHSRFGHYFCSNLYERAPRGVKKLDFFLQIKLLSFCARIAPKRHKLWKIVKIEKKMSKKPCLFKNFWIIFDLGAILVHQTSNGMFSRSWRIFWHPWHPWGRVNSGDISFLEFVFDFSVWQHHLADFFHYSQIEARCHLYWFDMYKSDNITFYSQNGWIFKVIQAVSVVIWMESELISPVWLWGQYISIKCFEGL